MKRFPFGFPLNPQKGTLTKRRAAHLDLIEQITAQRPHPRRRGSRSADQGLTRGAAATRPRYSR